MTLPFGDRYLTTAPEGKKRQKQQKVTFAKCDNAALLYLHKHEDNEIEQLKNTFEREINEIEQNCGDDFILLSLLNNTVISETPPVTDLHQISPTSSPENKKNRLPGESTQVLTAWFVSHSDHPYPSRSEKLKLSRESGMSTVQIRNWFTNMRKRHWKPIRKGREPRSYMEIVLMKQIQTSSASSETVTNNAYYI
mmetsp:Transcript_17366/g.21368  ORF Transcript_17366/g.21368 Transcript_17366/m.21368 type:complete len:195 (-) Transcript_17366:36-620(-)